MNILILTPFYPPVISTLANMVQELSNELVKKGHNVIVCSTVVRDRLSSDTIVNENINSVYEDGIRVIRVESRYQFSSNFILRGLYQILFPYLFWLNIRKKINVNVDVVFTYSPPLAWAILGKIIKKKYGAQYVLNIQDIFPQNAIDLGVLKNKLLVWFYEYQEKKVYDAADKLTSHTNNSRKFLISKKGIPQHKIELITNWIDIETYIESSNSNYYREIYGLKNKFIFLFAGVIGPSQGLDFIIKTAIKVKNRYPDICFLFVGDGIEKERLRGMVKKSKVDNVIFKPLVASKEYPKLLKNVDIGLVTLSRLNKTGVYPAKILGYSAASLPVCAILHKESDGHDLIKESGCGLSVHSNENQEVKNDLIIKMYNEKDKLYSYGSNGFKYVSKNFSKTNCINKIDNLINALIKN